jgi:hypothetical protein
LKTAGYKMPVKTRIIMKSWALKDFW